MLVCNLSFCNLIEADFRELNLENANLSSCIAYYTDFKKANLKGVNFENADVTGADFTGANLVGTNMKCRNLDKTLFEGSLYDDDTKWSEFFKPENCGCIKIG